MQYIDYREFYVDGIYEKYSDKLEEKRRLEYDLRVLKEELKLYLYEYYRDIYDYLKNNNIDVENIINLNEPTQDLIAFKNRLNDDDKMFEFELEYVSIMRNLNKINLFFENKIKYIEGLFNIGFNKFKMHLKYANDYFNGLITISDLVRYILNDVFKNDKFYYIVENQGNLDDFLYLIYFNVGVEYKLFYKLILDESIVQYNKMFDKEQEIVNISKYIWSLNNE